MGPRSSELCEALAGLDEITRRLRRECPWDREQDERSIVPHTVEEAYELADAARAADDAKLLDELGDVLFQVYFLALLLEEREAGDLRAVAESCTEKLIRRHPHVFGEVAAHDAATVRRNWDAIKREEPGRAGPFGDAAATLPATLLAQKALRRAGGTAPAAPPLEDAARQLGQAGGRDERFAAAGKLMLAAVAAAAAAGVDSELALRAAATELATGAERAAAIE